jgi:hypothetical protein
MKEKERQVEGKKRKGKKKKRRLILFVGYNVFFTFLVDAEPLLILCVCRV